jgi:hypothetical protein
MAQSPVPTREGLILSTATMDLAASAPVFAARVSLWATSLALVSAASAMPALVRGVGFVASLLFAVASLQMFAGRQLQRLRSRARGPGSHAPLGRGSGRASANSVRPLHQADVRMRCGSSGPNGLALPLDRRAERSVPSGVRRHGAATYFFRPCFRPAFRPDLREPPFEAVRSA